MRLIRLRKIEHAPVNLVRGGSGRSDSIKSVKSQTFCGALNSIDANANYICSTHKNTPDVARRPVEETEKTNMKNRNWFSYSLDMMGLVMLVGAGLALTAALWFAGATVETVLMGAFRTALQLAVGSFLVARSFEIALILKHEGAPAKPAAETFVADNVEQLPQRESLPRAA